MPTKIPFRNPDTIPGAMVSSVSVALGMPLTGTDVNPEKATQPEDLAEFMVAQLKLNRRIFIKEAGMWSTNP